MASSIGQHQTQVSPSRSISRNSIIITGTLIGVGIGACAGLWASFQKNATSVYQMDHSVLCLPVSWKLVLSFTHQGGCTAIGAGLGGFAGYKIADKIARALLG